MSVGTSDTTVISSTKTEAHSLNPTNASAAPGDGLSPANLPGNTAENSQFLKSLVPHLFPFFST